MSIGPVQLIALGFSKPEFKGEVIEELARLRDSDVVRVIDSLTVYKDKDGNVASLEMSQMDEADRRELGAYVGALIGFGAAGEEGAEIGAALGAEAAADDDTMLDDALDVLAEIPPDSAAAILLHRAPLGDPPSRRRLPGQRVPRREHVRDTDRPRRDRPPQGRGSDDGPVASPAS